MEQRNDATPKLGEKVYLVNPFQSRVREFVVAKTNNPLRKNKYNLKETDGSYGVIPIENDTFLPWIEDGILFFTMEEAEKKLNALKKERLDGVKNNLDTKEKLAKEFLRLAEQHYEDPDIANHIKKRIMEEFQLSDLT